MGAPRASKLFSSVNVEMRKPDLPTPQVSRKCSRSLWYPEIRKMNRFFIQNGELSLVREEQLVCIVHCSKWGCGCQIQRTGTSLPAASGPQTPQLSPKQCNACCIPSPFPGNAILPLRVGNCGSHQPRPELRSSWESLSVPILPYAVPHGTFDIYMLGGM